MDVDYPKTHAQELAPFCLGDDVRISASQISLGDGVVIQRGTRLIGSSIALDAGVSVGEGADLRAGTIDVGSNSEIASGVRVLVSDSFLVGPGSRLSRGVSITCRSFVAGNLLYFGNDVSVGFGGTLESTSKVTLGHRVAIGPRSILNANYPIVLQDQVGSGCDLTIWTHGFHFGHRILEGYTPTFAGVTVKRNVWLGFHCTVVPGVTIGENAILASGAVVASDIPPDSMAGGVPAKVKVALAPKAPTPTELTALLIDVLESWETELTWKGCATETADGVGHWKLAVRDRASDGAWHDVILWDGVAELTMPATGRRQIVISIDECPDAQDVCFELGPGNLRGAASSVSEDLRDHLRRHTLPCGDTTTFSSIEPQPFARLKAVD